MLVKQINKEYRTDLVIFRNTTEEFTINNETSKVFSLDSYDLMFYVYSPKDTLKTPVLTLTAERISEWIGKFKIRKDNTNDDYASLILDSYTYEIIIKEKTTGSRILIQQGILTINDIDSNA